MTPNVLFAKEHIYDFVEAQQKRCQRAYEALSDEDAVNEAVVQKLKAQFALEIPVLCRDRMDYEENHRRLSFNEFSGRNIIGAPGQAMRDVTEYVIHVPFEGDPKVFDLTPSAYNGTVALGEIVGHEILLRLSIDNPNIDVQGLIDHELEKIDWRLRNLRGSTAHLEEQLNYTLGMCRAARRRMIEAQANATVKLNVPKRPPAPVPVPTSSQQPPSETKKQALPPRNKGEKWDVFISHASEDKPYVDPLAKALEAAGVSVWYDTLVLKWGDDLRSVIDNGLINCRYGIVVLSKAFLGKKKWTEHELNGLFAREQAGKKLVLPIWHGIMRDDLLQYSPTLADRLAKISGSDSYEDIVNSLFVMLGRPISEQNSPARAPQVESSVRLLQLYYPDPDLRAHDLFRYFFSVNGRHVITNIATSKSWLGLAVPITTTEDSRFVLLESSENPWYTVPADEVGRLAAELRARDIRFENRPIYSLRSFTPTQGQIASFSVAQYADYKNEMGRLEEETHRVLAEIARIPEAHREQIRSAMPLREKLLPSSKSVAQYGNRLCAGGTNILLAFRTPGRNDYMFFIKQRSKQVSTGRLLQSLIPSGMHQPSTRFVTREETSVGATVYRGIDEELFSGTEPDPNDKDIEPFQFMSRPHIAWFRKNPTAFTLEIVSFGLNLVDGTFEFGVLLAIHDPSYWTKCTDQWKLEPNFEVVREITGDFYTQDPNRIASFKTEAPVFTTDQARLASVMTSLECADVSLIVLVEGLRRLKKLKPECVELPPGLSLSH